MAKGHGQYDDSYKVYEVADGIYWVGFADRNAGFPNNPYVITSGDEASVFDLGLRYRRN